MKEITVLNILTTRSQKNFLIKIGKQLAEAKLPQNFVPLRTLFSV